MKYQISLRYIKYVYEDILNLHARFGYNTFIRSETDDMNLRYSMKKLLNYAAVEKDSKAEGRIYYRLDKYVVEYCNKFKERHE